MDKYKMELRTVNEVELDTCWDKDSLKGCYDKLMKDLYTYGILKKIIKNCKYMDWYDDEGILDVSRDFTHLCNMIYIDLTITYDERISWKIPLYFEGEVDYESIWFPDDLNEKRGTIKELELFDFGKYIKETLKVVQQKTK